MGDMGEFWRDVKEHQKKQKSEWQAKTREPALQTFLSSGWDYEVKNHGEHYIIKNLKGKGVADYWPSNGTYHIRGSGEYPHGVKNLIKDLAKIKY